MVREVLCQKYPKTFGQVLIKYVWGSAPGGKFFIVGFDGNLYFRMSLLLFYLIPLLILVVQGRKAFSEEPWQHEPVYLLLTTSPAMKYIPILLVA
jgi:hypothetical protein